MNILGMLGKAEAFSKKNSPAILAGLAVCGVIVSTWTAFRAGSKADAILEKHRQDMADCHPDDKETKRAVQKETFKEMAPIAIPVILMGTATIAAIIGSHSVSSRRIAALSAAYTLSESTVKNLNNKMEEMLGEKKARSIKDAIIKDKVAKDADKDRQIMSDGQMVMPNNGTVLCKDLYSGRLFYSSAEKIQQAITKCSYDIIQEMYISLNEFYEAINSPQLGRIPLGDDLGWNLDDIHNGQLPIVLTAVLTDDKKPCLCIDYDIGLRQDFRNLH